MVETLSPLNPNYTQGLNAMAHSLADAGQSASGTPMQAAAQLYGAIGRQAQMLSYIDIFHILMVFVFAAIPLLLFVKGPKAGESGGGGAV
jgi:DHA2 family multidrug resistance protein